MLLNVGRGTERALVCPQVGKTGAAVGIDIKAAAVQLSRASVQGLVCSSPEFARGAGSLRFHTHNVFMPSLCHKVGRAVQFVSLIADVAGC